MRTAIWLLLALGMVLLLPPHQGSGYSNYPLGGWEAGGPHRTINAFAVERFTGEAGSDPVLSRYDFNKATLTVSGPRIGEPGIFVRGNWSGLGDKPETFQWWVTEGGYSADEPELYASFRHFFDPQAEDIGQPPYLTDHLDQVGGYFKLIGKTLQLTGQPITGEMLNEIGRNPEVDARDWAINGSASAGWGENEYSLNRGVEYLRLAFASRDATEKSKYFAQAWRSLGETMHLLADMTVPAHVRNDSHPAFNINWSGLPVELRNPDPNVGFLKGDPYETWAQDSMIKRVAGGDVDATMAVDIDRSLDAEDLFYLVAYFTSSTFFSGETVSGTEPETGADVHSANGMPDHASPDLGQTAYDPKTGYYTASIGGKDVCLAHRSWLSEIGWGGADPRITRRCAESQAEVLVPVAVAGNARLLDLFVPRVKVEITEADTENHVLRGSVVHEPYGILPDALSFSTAVDAFNPFYLNGSIQDWDDYVLTVEDGNVTVTYGDSVAQSIEDARAAGPTVVSLAIDIGGIEIRSNDFPLTKTTPTPTPTSTSTPTPSATQLAGAGAWVLKSTEPLKEVGQETSDSCYRDHEVTMGGLSATTYSLCSQNTSCEFWGRSHHSWSAAPPPHLTPGEKWQVSQTVSSEGTGAACGVWGAPRTDVSINLDPGGTYFGYEGRGAQTQGAPPDSDTAVLEWTIPSGGEGMFMRVSLSFSGPGGSGWTTYRYEWQGP